METRHPVLRGRMGSMAARTSTRPRNTLQPTSAQRPCNLAASQSTFMGRVTTRAINRGWSAGFRARRSLLVLVVTGLAATAGVGCGSQPPTAPGSPPVLIRVEIRPRPTQVSVGQTFELKAFGIYSDGSSDNGTSAVWVASPNGVASIDTLGRLTGIRLGVVAVTMARDGLNDALSVRVTDEASTVPSVSLAGAWSGTANWIDCTRASGPGPSPCAVGTATLVRLVLEQPQPYTLIGSLSLGSATGLVQGWRDVVGRMFLSGSMSFDLGHGPHTYELTDWSVRLVAPFDRLSGRFEVTERFDNAFGPQLLRSTFESTAMLRQ
jgi:hypothetical protein